MAEDDLNKLTLADFFYLMTLGIVTGWMLYGVYLLGHWLLEQAGVMW